jgi:hypothetical protein
MEDSSRSLEEKHFTDLLGSEWPTKVMRCHKMFLSKVGLYLTKQRPRPGNHILGVR